MLQPYDLFDVISNTEFPESSSEFLLRIKTGKFSGTLFSFGQIQFIGEDEEGNGKINFDYELLSLTEGVTLEDPEVRGEFEKDLSAILHTIIEASLQHENNRNSDSEQSTL